MTDDVTMAGPKGTQSSLLSIHLICNQPKCLLFVQVSIRLDGATVRVSRNS